MKILVFYTPRSKSTALHDALAKFYNLEPLGDVVTQSRIKNKSFIEYPALINKINSTENICVKLNGNDFIDLANQEISELYKDINFKSFDKIFFITRNNIVDAIASYAYMNPADQSTWHKPRGTIRIGSPYVIPVQKMFYLLRGYDVYNMIKEYILAQTLPGNIYDYEYETVEQELKHALDIDMLNVNIEPNGYNYRCLAENYQTIAQLADQVFQDIKLSSKDKTDFFWANNLHS